MLFHATVLALALQSAIQEQGPPAPSTEKVLALGHPSALRLTGTSSLKSASVLAGLRTNPDFFESSHPMRLLEEHLSWLEASVALGYQHLGFTTVVVEARAHHASGTVEIEVREGPQLLAGDIFLEGAQLLDPEWLRVALRAGLVKRIAGAHLPAPPGQAVLEPVLPLELGKAMPLPFWVPGEPAPLSDPDRQRFEDLALEAAHAAGLLAARLSVRWDGAETGTVHPVVVIEEGPLHLVERVRLEGEFSDPAQVLLDWAAIPPGTPANEAVSQAAADRVRATGRFGSVSAGYVALEADPGRVELVLQIVEAPSVPSLEQQPADDLALLRRAILRFSDEAAHPLGMDFDLSLPGKLAQPLLSLGASLGTPVALGDSDRLSLRIGMRRELAALELGLLREGSAPLILASLYCDGQDGLASCPPLALQLGFPASRLKFFILVSASYSTPQVATSEGFELEVSAGAAQSFQAASAPLRAYLDVSPAALLYLYLKGIAPAEPHPQFLERLGPREDGSTVRALIERDNASSRFEVEISKENGLVASAALGDLEDLATPEWVSGLENAFESTTLDATLKWLDGLRALDPKSGAGGLLNRPERVLLLTGLQALLDAAGNEPEDAGGRVDTFIIPRTSSEPESPESSMRAIAESVALRMIARVPAGSWGDFVFRTFPNLLLPGSPRDSDQARGVMKIFSTWQGLGPLSAWSAAELCVLGNQPAWAASIASAGRKHLSSATFLTDLDSLCDLDAGLPASSVARAWRLRYERASSTAGEPLSLDEREMLEATFGSLDSQDETGAWVRAGLTRLWDSQLHDLVERRLVTLEGAGQGR